MALLSDADVFDAPQAGAKAPTQQVLSDEDVFGGPDAIDRSAMDWASPGTQAANVLKDVGTRLGTGTVAALDMILGVPALAIGVGADAGARAYALGAGESPDMQIQAGAAAKEAIPAQIEKWLGMSRGGLSTPIQTILRVTGRVEPYDQSKVSEAIDSVAASVERAGIAKAGDVKSYIDVAMLAGLAKGGDATAKAMLEKKTATGADARGSYDEGQAPVKAAEGVPLENPDVSRLIPKYDTEGTLTGWELKLGQPPMPEPPTKAAQAKVTKARLKDVREAFKNDPETADWLKAQTEQSLEAHAQELVAEATKQGRDGRPYDPAALAEEVSAIVQKPGWQRTPEEMIKVREYNRNAFVDQYQQGKIDPELLPYMIAGVAGGTALAAGGIALYKYFQKHGEQPWKPPVDEEQEQGRAVRERMFKGMQPKDFVEPPKGQDLNPLAPPTRVFPKRIWADAGEIAKGIGTGALLLGAIRAVHSGVFPEESVTRVADPLISKLAPEAPVDSPQANWARKAIKDYLPKSFGLDNDPLRNVKVQTSEGVKTWGELTDTVTKSAKIPKRLELLKKGEAAPGEDIWSVEAPKEEVAGQALDAYMQKVGAYLKDNVPVEKLSEYDFPRAVQEMAAKEVAPKEVPEVSSEVPLAERGSADPRHLAAIAAVAGGAAINAYLNPEHPIVGAIKGAAGGLGIAALLSHASPRAWGEAIRRMADTRPLVKIEDLVRERLVAMRVGDRATYQLVSRIQRAVPEQARREAIYDFLDGRKGVTLSPVEAKVAQGVRQFYDELGRAAKDSGVVKQLLDDYATRIYGKPSKGILESRRVGEDTRISSPFGKPRGYATREEAAAAGYIPITTDIAQVMDIYSKSVRTAIENRRFVNTLKEQALPDGTKLVTKLKGSPPGYVQIDNPQLEGYRVHPDIAPDLRFVFEAKSPGAIVNALDAINATQKRLGVSASLFHATALEHAMLGATSIFKSPIVGLKAFGQSFAPAIFGESLAVKMIREGHAGDSIEQAMRGGLELTFQNELPTVMEERLPIYRAMDAATKYLDETIPGAGKVTTGAFTQLNHAFDRAMWGRFQTTLKVETWLDKSRELSRNNAREIESGKPGKPQAELDRMAASFTNDLYGGLNWYQLVTEFNARWSRELAAAAFSPAGRLGMRMMLFAPDWTISTTRAFAKSFGARGIAAGAGAVVGSQVDPKHSLMGGVIGGLMGLGVGKALKLEGGEGSGLKGILRPTELADLHRQYFLRSALIYSSIVDAINYKLSGHHIWDNKDPTRLDRGDGTTMQVSKHFMEPFHWLLSPRQQALNKLSFIVKEPANQIMDTEYLSTHGAPRMGGTPKGEDISLPTRLGHAARQFTPITAQSFEAANPTKSLWSALGAPVYGKTYAERAAIKEKRKQDAVQRRIEKRAREGR